MKVLLFEVCDKLRIQRLVRPYLYGSVYRPPLLPGDGHCGRGRGET